MTRSVFRAGYVPGLAESELAWHTLNFGDATDGLVVRVPALTPAQLRALALHVKQAASRHLKPVPLARIIEVLDSVTERLRDRSHPSRQLLERWLPITSGFDTETVRLGLSQSLKTFRRPQLERFLAEDFPNPIVLDRFQPRMSGGWSRAMGPDLLVHVWAGNVPGLPLWGLASGLLVKAGMVGKVPSAEPVFATVFARLLAEIEPLWADCLAVVWWQGGDAERERALLPLADVVMAYGGNEALQDLRQRIPVGTRFLAHGHKLSAAMVSARCLSVRKSQIAARQTALDVARYEQQGCYSPHVVYVARGGRVSPLEFAQQIASELAALQHKFPRHTLALAEATTMAAWRQAHEFKAMQSSNIVVLGQPSDPWCVVVAQGPQALAPSPLNRCVLVVAEDDLEQAAAQLAPQKAYLQSVGVAVAPQELMPLAQALADAGVTRICAIGSMTAVQEGWHHDGRYSLLDLVRWVDIEASAEDFAESFDRHAD